MWDIEDILTLTDKTCTRFMYKEGKRMPITTTYSSARNQLAKLLNEVTDNQEVVIIKRRGKESVALISASELSSILETNHLLRSPKNAARLMKAMERSKSENQEAMTIEELKREIGLGSAKE